MEKCLVCDETVSEGWSFCPYCGSNLDSEPYLEDRIDKIRYMWERQEGGRFIYEHFPAVKSVGITPYKKIKPFRTTLGDYTHILLSDLRDLSFPYLNSNHVTELYKIGKLMGYYSACEAFNSLRLNEIIKLLNKPGLSWNIFNNKLLVKAHRDGWSKQYEGIIDLVGIDKRGKQMEYTLKESPFSVLESNKPLCFIDIGILCGNVEAVSSGFWDGFESKCQCVGDDCCHIKLEFHEGEQEPSLEKLGKEELGDILEQLTTMIVNRDRNLRETMGDYVHISGEQCFNYLLTSLSPGHRILSKHAGRISGERIAEKANVEGLDIAFSYLGELFLYLKAGILDKPERRGDRYFIEMSESVYAAGVDNIHTELCIFLAGLIEGVLNKATDKKWYVDEICCIASGYSKCKFMCKPLTR